MFEKPVLDALFSELDDRYKGSADYEQLLRQTHLAIALSDANRDFDTQVDQRVAELVEKHQNGN